MKNTKQIIRVFNTITDGRWHTLAGIGKKVDAPTQSVSARLRDLRKKQFGANIIDKRPRGTVFVYRLG
jgi:hypothetical protein